MTSTAASTVAGFRSRPRMPLLRQLLSSRQFVVGAVIVGFWLAIAILGDIAAPFDPYKTDLRSKLQAPSLTHLFGTDALGRDVLSRVMLGARDILITSLTATALATVLGASIGLAMGYFGGRVDELLSRVAEAVIAMPSLIFALVLLAALGPSVGTVIAVVGFRASWVIARTVRIAVMSERDEDYVSAAHVRAERTPWVLFGEILPNVSAVIVVEFTTRIAFSIFEVSSLSFLGFGLQPPSPDWGLQIADSYALLPAGDWWVALFPAAAIATLVVGVYLVAEAVGEAIIQ